MKLHTKFFCFVEGGMLLGVVLLSTLLRRHASREVTSAARRQLEQSVAIVATHMSLQFSRLIRDVDLWAQFPLTLATARGDRNPGQTAAFNRFFIEVREAYGMFHAITLVNPEADCVATGNPETDRLQHSEQRAMVVLRDDFRAALNGKTVISEPLVQCAGGRPCLAVSAPVGDGDAIIAVLRVVVDLELLNRKWLAPLSAVSGSRVRRRWGMISAASTTRMASGGWTP